MLRFYLLTLLLHLCFRCRIGSASVPLPEPTFKPVVTIFAPNILLETPDKTNATIRFTALSGWFIVVNNEKSSVSWISINNTSGEAGTIELMVERTDPNLWSLTSRAALLKIVSDTAFRMVSIPSQQAKWAWLLALARRWPVGIPIDGWGVVRTR